MSVTSRGSLPATIARFVGRESELRRACDLLGHVRLLTLTGPGGVGKTRLALQVSERLQNERLPHERPQRSAADVAWIVDLTSLHNPDDPTPERLYEHIALALKIRLHGPASLDVIVDHLGARRALLVLDNCEHLLSATRACVTALLRAAPQLRVLATSRQTLRADGEHALVVPPMALPDAIALFRAQAAAVGINASEVWSDVSLVADLCRRLDCLPLAIQLAAGRLRTLAPRQLFDLLNNRFRVLSEASALMGNDDLGRHSTMERVVEWSYDLCTGPEQKLWARASIFASAFDLPALQVICGGDGIDSLDIVDLVSALVEKSVFSVDRSTEPYRYSLLDTLREYGLRKLDGAGEVRRIRNAHREYFHDQVARLATSWLGPGELDALAQAHRSLPEILAAVDECVAENDLPAARAICRDLVRLRAPFFWGFLDAIRQRLLRFLSDPGPVTSASEALDLSSTAAAAAWMSTTQGLHGPANELLATAHDLLHRWHLEPTGEVLFAEGATEALGAGSHRAIGLLAHARTAFDAPDTLGDYQMVSMLWTMATAFAGEADDAAAAGDEYLEWTDGTGAPWAISWARWTTALSALRNDNFQQATELVTRALRMQRDMDDQWGQTWSLEVLAWIIAAQIEHADDPLAEAQRAAWLLGAARARQAKLGVTLAGLRPLAAGHDRAVTHIAAVLDELTVAAEMQAGERNSRMAVRLALGEQPPPRRRRGRSSGTRRTSSNTNLSHRELEVVALVAEGLTSKAIGSKLGMTARTAETHVQNARRKLGLRSRTALVTWFMQSM